MTDVVLPQAIALARLRIDRVYGQGAFDDMQARIQEDPSKALIGIARHYDRICAQEIEAAKTDWEDMIFLQRCLPNPLQPAS